MLTTYCKKFRELNLNLSSVVSLLIAHSSYETERVANDSKSKVFLGDLKPFEGFDKFFAGSRKKKLGGFLTVFKISIMTVKFLS